SRRAWDRRGAAGLWCAGLSRRGLRAGGTRKCTGGRCGGGACGRLPRDIGGAGQRRLWPDARPALGGRANSAKRLTRNLATAAGRAGAARVGAHGLGLLRLLVGRAGRGPAGRRRRRGGSAGSPAALARGERSPLGALLACAARRLLIELLP